MNESTECNGVKIGVGLGRGELPAGLVARGYVRGAEVGVQKGEYSEVLLRAGVRKLLMVDSWAHRTGYFDIANVGDAEHERNFREARLRVRRWVGARIMRMVSVEAALLVGDGSLDFVYLDGNHCYEAVVADLAAWVRKVRVGGMVCGHDFLDSPNCCGSSFGVRSAVLEYCRRVGVGEVFVAEEDFPNWHFFKTS